MRRFLNAGRDVLCSKMMPSGKGVEGLNDTHSLRQIPAMSGDGGVKKYELPIIKESKSYTFTEFAPKSVVRMHSHDEAQLRIITRGSFDFVVGDQRFAQLEEADWIYIPKDTLYSISTNEGGAVITGYGVPCD
jgi:quercetin dioxygenase-like cupin family protein